MSLKPQIKITFPAANATHDEIALLQPGGLLGFVAFNPSSPYVTTQNNVNGVPQTIIDFRPLNFSRSISVRSAGDIRTTHFIVHGTQNGAPQTDDITGPNAGASANGNSTFDTITSIQITGVAPGTNFSIGLGLYNYTFVMRPNLNYIALGSQAYGITICKHVDADSMSLYGTQFMTYGVTFDAMLADANTRATYGFYAILPPTNLTDLYVMPPMGNQIFAADQYDPSILGTSTLWDGLIAYMQFTDVGQTGSVIFAQAGR